MSDQVNTMNGKSAAQVSLIAFAMLLLGGVALGTSPIFMRYAEVSPTSSAFWRVWIAVPPLLIWQIYAMRKSKRASGISWSFDFARIKPLIYIGFFFATDMIAWHWSIRLTTVANATLLANMAVIFTAIGGFIFFGERFSRTFIGGMAIALIGAISLMGHSLGLDPGNLRGDLIAFAAAISYAGFMILTGQARKDYTTGSIMLGAAFFSGLFMLPVALMEPGNFIPETLFAWWPLLALGLFTHVIGQGLIIYALAHLPTAFGSVTLLVQPVIAAILAWILFAEALGIFHLIGATLIITGIFVCKKGVRR